MKSTNPQADEYFKAAKKWPKELKRLRKLVLDCELAETVKWGSPCYLLQDRNVVLLHVFKEYCAMLFFKGALLKDPKGILVRPGEHTQAGRQIRFTNLAEVTRLESTVKAYIREAIKVEQAGLKVKLKQDLSIPEELQTKLDALPALKTAFYALTPGRQRAYAFYFSAAKQSKTRTSRIEKCMPQILEGKGLNDE